MSRRGKKPDNPNWAKYVVTLRKRRGLSRRAFAEKVRCDPSLITLMERGHVPQVSTLESWPRVLRVPEDELLLMAGYVPVNLTEQQVQLVVAALRALKEVA
ncbi:MAG: helix-turn-helix domain-containing protein [Vulcanimicrobiota bacterium]